MLEDLLFGVTRISRPSESWEQAKIRIEMMQAQWIQEQKAAEEKLKREGDISRQWDGPREVA